MKYGAPPTLTRAYIQKSDLYLSIASASSILCILLSFFWMLFHIGGDRGTILFADIAYGLFALLGAAWALRVIYKSRRGPFRMTQQYERAWFLIAIGECANGVGGLYYAYLEYKGLSPFPSYADIGFTMFYVFALVGLLTMPTELRFRARMGFDAVITTLCLLGISWFFVIGPAYFSRVGSVTTFKELLSLLLGLSYPCWDIALIFALLLLIQRRSQPALYSTFLLLGLGIASLVWADSAYAYTNIFTQTYQSGTASIDPFWFISALLIGLASLSQYNILLHRAYQQQIKGKTAPLPTRAAPSVLSFHINHLLLKRFQSFSIYTPLTLLLILTVYGELASVMNARYLVVLTALVGVLVTVRYMLTTHENEHLTLEMSHQHQQSELLRRLNTQLADILDLETLQERIVDITTQQLGFDTAILLLLEDWVNETQSPFRVHASSTIGKMKEWRFQGNSFLSYLLLNGQSAEVRWEKLIEETPAEIYLWHKEEHISTTHFFPLVYQGHTLGCLGVAARRYTLSRQDHEVVRLFAEQLAALVEHALLYKEAREHEAFSRAMANIATRLNAAVIDPGDIYQLICSEGANALQADFSILYVPQETAEQDPQSQLTPLAAYAVGSIVPISDWPTIRAHQSPMSAFHSLQPMLIAISSPPSSPLPLDTGTRPAQQALVPVRRGLDSFHMHYITAPLSLRERRRQEIPGTNGQPENQHQHTLTIHDKLLMYSVQTAIYAPLISAGEPVGLLVFARSVPLGMYDRQSFGNESLPFAQDFAEQAAVALTNAHLYQHLRSTHQRLQELDELKDQFMVTASHELRTPLTAVQGYIELLAQFDETLSTEERREFLQRVQRSCNELVIMLDNVMDASRIERETSQHLVTLERVDVREMIESIIAILSPQLQQECRQAVVDIVGNVFVHADPVRLRQVLMNLSLNALKYSPPSTPITYSTRYVERTSDSIPSIIISVIDRGKGIAPYDQPRLFQRFMRLESDINSPVRGSGVGLYISRRLVELMQGRIWVESRGIEGEGSAFHVQLPALGRDTMM